MGIATFTHECEADLKKAAAFIKTLPEDGEDAAKIFAALLADYSQLKAAIEGGNLLGAYQDAINDIAALKTQVAGLQADLTAGIAAAKAAGATTAPTAAAQANAAAATGKVLTPEPAAADEANHGTAV